MHLTLKNETMRPPGMNSLQQQSKFDDFLEEFISRSSQYYQKKPRGSRADRRYDEHLVSGMTQESKALRMRDLIKECAGKCPAIRSGRGLAMQETKAYC